MLLRKFLALALLSSVSSFAEPLRAADASGRYHGAHMAGSPNPAGKAREAGQAAFAAIQETISLLDADASTDWSRVDIPALHQHLIDMSNLTLSADAKTEPVEGGARFTITGAGAVRDSIRRMVAGHAEVMDGVGGWRFAVEEHSDGAVLTVTVDRADDVVKLRALGFIGLMTRGMHHQAHHLMIATGRGPHK